jgi:hypothetical protein
MVCFIMIDLVLIPEVRFDSYFNDVNVISVHRLLFYFYKIMLVLFTFIA